jgi:hypothetical protein
VNGIGSAAARVAAERMSLVHDPYWCYHASMHMRAAPAVLVALMALPLGAGMGAANARSTNAHRQWRESIAAPAQFDLALLEVSFRAPRRLARSVATGSRLASSIRLGLPGPTGLDYVAAAATRPSVPGGPRALVLVVNRRPRGSLAPDLARIGFTVLAPRRLGSPVIRQVADPFTRPSPGLTPALCDLPVRGPSLTGSDLGGAVSRGVALSGYSPEASIAEAYDVLCGRPYDQAFRQVVTQGSPPICATGQANIVSCCPPNAMCAPPCPACPCGTTPCAIPAGRSREALIACPLRATPIVCPL